MARSCRLAIVTQCGEKFLYTQLDYSPGVVQQGLQTTTPNSLALAPTKFKSLEF